MDAGDRQRAAAVEGPERRRDERADRGEQDGGVERFGGASASAPTLAAPRSSANCRAWADRVRTWTRVPSAIATWAVRWAEPPKP